MSEKSKNFQDSAKKIYIRTFGCQMNDRDSEALMGLFLDEGYQAAEDEGQADVVLVNTCSVRAHAENRALSYLGSLKKFTERRRTRGAKRKVIGLIGCMARNIGEEVYNKMPYIDLICGPASLAKIPAYCEKIKKDNIRIIDLDDTLRDEEFYRSTFRLQPDYAQVVISTGCSNYCSYCVVPFVRGELRLRKPEDIIDEVRRNIDLGIKKITLLGQNVNDYEYKSQVTSHKSQVNFVDLLKKIEKIERVEEINFITSQPRNVPEGLFEFMAGSKKISKHLHLPFQSGSNRILKKMNRGYTREKYLQLADSYKKIVNGTLSTDVIAGFPTETDKDFLATKDILEKVRFRNAYIFKYSPRLKAKSSKMLDDVPEEIKVKRHKILLDLQKKISLDKF